MKQFLQELGGRLFERLLGCDGAAAAVLLAMGLWCGHYAVRVRRARPGELLVLVPAAVASFAGAAFVCDGVAKFLGLLVLALLAYGVAVYGSNTGRPGGGAAPGA